MTVSTFFLQTINLQKLLILLFNRLFKKEVALDKQRLKIIKIIYNC